MRDALFMGRILALVTHEMQNVMAIIKESGALADDILKLNGPPRMRHGDKLDSSLVNIQQQVERGRGLMIMLNGFAHAAADYPESGDLARFARQICIPAQRMAHLKECALNASLDVPPLVVRGNALTLMESVHAGLAAVLEGCKAGDTLHVSIAPPQADTEGPVLRVQAEKSLAEPEQRAVAPIMAELGGSCRAGAGFLELRYAAAPAQGEANP